MPSRTTTTAACRTILRPRFTVRTGDPVRIEPGRVMICPTRPSQRVQIVDLSRAGTDAEVILEVILGMGPPPGRHLARYRPLGNWSATHSTPATGPSGTSHQSKRRPGPMGPPGAPAH
jgi:hypothetical protein